MAAHVPVVEPIAESASVRLDALRALAAIVVVVGHIGDLFLVPAPPSAVSGAPLLVIGFALHVATNLAHQAVMVFFVLSGFLVGGEVLRQRDDWSWHRYLVTRLTRLWVVLLPALCLTFAFDNLGRGLGDASRYARLDSSWTTFIGNALFLQTIAVPTFGSNGSLWSLANEFWYYLLFPMMAIGLLRGAGLSRLVYAATTIGLAWLLPRGFAGGFVIWIFGAAARIRVGGRMRLGSPTLQASSLAAMLSLLVAIGAGWFGGRLSDFVLGAAVALWLHAIVASPPSASRPAHTADRASRWMAERSYSLYAVHFPLLLLIRAGTGDVHWQPGLAAVAAIIGLTSVSVLCAALFAGLTERHTRALRTWLLRMWTPDASKSPAASAAAAGTMEPLGDRR